MPRRRAVSADHVQAPVPMLQRTLSARPGTWPSGTGVKSGRGRGLSTANVLSNLVAGSYHNDSDNEDDEGDGALDGLEWEEQVF